MSEAREFKVVGTRVVRPDGVDKVTGRANFGADFTLPGMLYGKVLRSPHAHARIKKIDTTAAAKIEGVYAIATGADFPKVGHEEITGGEGGGDFADLATQRHGARQGRCITATPWQRSRRNPRRLPMPRSPRSRSTTRCLPPVMDLDTAMADRRDADRRTAVHRRAAGKTDEAEQRRGVHGVQARRHREGFCRSRRRRRRHVPDADRASGLHRAARVRRRRSIRADRRRSGVARRVTSTCAR